MNGVKKLSQCKIRRSTRHVKDYAELKADTVKHEAYRKQRSKYIKDNRAHYNHLESRRRANMYVELNTKEQFLVDALYVMSSILSRSCGEQYEVDHIHPVSRGGLHTFDNLQILTRNENRTKWAHIM